MTFGGVSCLTSAGGVRGGERAVTFVTPLTAGSSLFEERGPIGSLKAAGARRQSGP